MVKNKIVNDKSSCKSYRSDPNLTLTYVLQEISVVERWVGCVKLSLVVCVWVFLVRPHNSTSWPVHTGKKVSTRVPRNCSYGTPEKVGKDYKCLWESFKNKNRKNYLHFLFELFFITPLCRIKKICSLRKQHLECA